MFLWVKFHMFIIRQNALCWPFRNCFLAGLSHKVNMWIPRPLWRVPDDDVCSMHRTFVASPLSLLGLRLARRPFSLLYRPESLFYAAKLKLARSGPLALWPLGLDRVSPLDYRNHFKLYSLSSHIKTPLY